MKSIEEASSRAIELAKKLGIEYTPPELPDLEEERKKTDAYFVVMSCQDEIRSILDSFNDEELQAVVKDTNSKTK